MNPLTGTAGYMLAHKANGECIYLGEDGCTIYDRAPVLCQAYDCRLAYKIVPRRERRRRLALGLADKAKLKAGRDRLHTLDPDWLARERAARASTDPVWAEKLRRGEV